MRRPAPPILFVGHDCQTAAYARLAGLKNGGFADRSRDRRIRALMTTDQEIPFQQNMSGRKIAGIVLCAQNNRLADLKLLIPATLQAIKQIEPQVVSTVDSLV